MIVDAKKLNIISPYNNLIEKMTDTYNFIYDFRQQKGQKCAKILDYATEKSG